VSYARPAGIIPAGPTRTIVIAGRAGWFACAGILAALNAQDVQILSELRFHQSLAALANLAGISGVIWFAMFAALRIGLDRGRAPVTKVDRCVIALVRALSLLPIAAAAKVALELSALYLLLTSRPQDDARRVGIVLLALTGPLIWGRIILDSFAGPLLSADAHLVGAVIGTPVHANIVQFADSSHEFLIGIGCSSVHNISLAIVLWATAAALFRIRFDCRYLACGVAMIAFMFGLNIVRLSAIGLYPQDFFFLHDGVGAELFGWAALVGSGLLALMGVNNAVARQQ
jgi:hypothetical protein